MKEASSMGFPEAALKDEQVRIDELLNRKEGVKASELKRALGTTMFDKVGIFRNKRDLETAIRNVAALKRQFEGIAVLDSSRKFNTSLVEILELGFELDLADVIVVCAVARKESRGAHYRTDFPKRDDSKWLKHSLAVSTAEGPRISYNPVTVTRFKPEERGY